MKKSSPLVFVALLCGLYATSLSAGPIARSQTDFSANQGQNNWHYGFYNQGSGGPHSYTTADFSEFDTFTGTSWTASDGLVGAQNNDFLRLNSAGGHPTGIGPGGQDSIIWAVRRYVSPFAGLQHINFDLRKLNIGNPNGGGITGRIFVDGAEVFTQFITNTDGVGVQSSLNHLVGINSVIDFAIDPTGIDSPNNDGPFAARADGSHFSANIFQSVPEPITLLLLGTGLIVLVYYRRKA